jgi:polyferredoxin
LVEIHIYNSLFIGKHNTAKLKNIAKALITRRSIIQFIIGLAIYLLLTWYHLSLWYLVIAGVVTGVIFGKVFCRWMCPMGIIMEFIMGFNPDSKFRQMYQYHKLGCPIAWIQGALNKYSLMKIHVDHSSCRNCGICDKQCYITTLEPTKYSLYKKGLSDPAENFSCSKCLKCVEVCPNGSLKYK